MVYRIRKENFKGLMAVMLLFCAILHYCIWKKILVDTSVQLYFTVILLLSWFILASSKFQMISVPVISLTSMLFFLWMGPIVLHGIRNTQYDYHLVLLTGTFILFFAFYFVGEKFLGRRQKADYANSNYRIKQSQRIISWAYVFFFVGTAATLKYILNNVTLLLGSYANDGRITALSGSGMLIYLGKLMWLAVFISLEESLLNDKYKLQTALMTIISCTLSLAVGFRSAIVDAFLVIIVMYNKAYPINQKKLLCSCVMLIAVVLSYGILRSGSDSSLLGELLIELRVGSVNLSNIIDKFPKWIEFQNGYTYALNFQMLRPGPDLDFTLWLKNALGMEFSGGGVTPTILGEFYINWGILGCCIGMSMFGLVAGYLQNRYMNSEWIFIPSLFIGYIRSFIRGGFANSFLVLIIYVAGYLFCRLVSTHIVIKIPSSKR